MAKEDISFEDVDPSVLARLVDVHCHPVESPYDDKTIDDLPIHICAMATTASDQHKIATLARKWPSKVTPAFGMYHPGAISLIPLTSPRRLPPVVFSCHCPHTTQIQRRSLSISLPCILTRTTRARRSICSSLATPTNTPCPIRSPLGPAR